MSWASCSWITLIFDPTVWLNGARSAYTCILPSFPWMAPMHNAVYLPIKVLSPLNWLFLLGYATWCASAIQGKEGRIQVLAGLAPSSQTVGSNIRVLHEQAKRSSGMTEVKLAPNTWQQSWVRGKGSWLGGPWQQSLPGGGDGACCLIT